MISSTFAFLHLSMVVLIVGTLTATANVSQSPEEAASVRYNNEQHANSALTDHRTSAAKQVIFEDNHVNEFSNSNSVEENSSHYPNQAAWFPVISKRYVKKLARAGSSVISGGDGRLWAIPYRFGKRGTVLPYRFGKRAAAMHFRMGKKSAVL